MLDEGGEKARVETDPALLDTVHRRGLQLRQLVPVERALVGAALLATAFCGALVIWESVPLSLPGGRVLAAPSGDVETLGGELVPTLVMTVGCLGVAAASAVF